MVDGMGAKLCLIPEWAEFRDMHEIYKQDNVEGFQSLFAR